MYEHDAPAYRAVSSFVLPKDLVGSEFFGAEYQSGEYGCCQPELSGREL